LYDYFAEFLVAQRYNERKREKTQRLMRRLIGRAHPTGREIHTLLGVFRQAREQLEHRQELLDQYDEPDRVGDDTASDGDANQTGDDA